jgi:hypothetical protein
VPVTATRVCAVALCRGAGVEVLRFHDAEGNADLPRKGVTPVVILCHPACHVAVSGGGGRGCRRRVRVREGASATRNVDERRDAITIPRNHRRACPSSSRV